MSTPAEHCATYRAKHAEKIAAAKAAYRAANKDKIKAYNALHYQSNQEKHVAKALAWQAAHPEEAKAGKRADSAKHYAKRRPAKLERAKRYNATPEAKEKKNEWKRNNPEIVAALGAKRRAQKKNANAAWAEQFLIQEIYALAKLRTKITGFKWEVDHIYPLQSDLVCGLHVENNLRVIPATVNRAKRNTVTQYG